MVKTFQDLIVWQKAMVVTERIYAITKSFPKDEMFGLTSQMRRSAVSVPSNIAEGKLRGTPAEFRRFLSIAFGSCGELQTQLLLAVRIGYLSQSQAQDILNHLNEVLLMTNELILRNSPHS
ncbi:four helix bundle protein [Patescibacteria group bacterium]|nr:MAG: four helix bundle protein [Patescibacteria group bacterium]